MCLVTFISMATSAHALSARLHGSEPLQERLVLAERAFLAPLNVPVMHKEDVVVIWLSQLLTNKSLTLDLEDLEAVWRTMNTILNSRRLKALCSNNWLCPISSSFAETLVDIINSSLEDTIRENAIIACHVLLSNPVLAPLITRSAEHCIFLTKGLIQWLVEGHQSDLDVTLTLMATLEAGAHLRIQRDVSNAFLSVIDHFLLPHARLNVVLKNNKREIVQKLLKKINSVVTENLFKSKLVNLFTQSLDVLLSEETKESLSTVVETLLVFVVSAVENESLEISQFLLTKFFSGFSAQFRSKVLPYQMLIVLCHMLDVSLSRSEIPSLEKNSFAVQKLKSSNIDKEKQEALLFCILNAAESSSMDVTASVRGVSLKQWLENLGETLLKTAPLTPEGYHCLRTLLVMIPQAMSGLILKNLWNICFKKVPVMTQSMTALYSAYDDLLCDVLGVCVRMRHIPKTFSRILFGFKKDIAFLENQQIIPDTLLVYEGQLLLPPRFMVSIMKAIGTLGHYQVLLLWKTTMYFATKESTALVEGQANASTLKFLSIVIWLLSCVMKASSVVQVMSVAGVAQSFASIMEKIALHVIKPFITAMLTQPHNNDICGSILDLCHTWGEIHTYFLTSDTGYIECPDLLKVQSPKPSTPTDFSYLLPFISSEAWAQISARVANFGNQPTQLSLVQLVIQKLSQAAVKHQRCGVSLTTVSSNHSNKNPTEETLETLTKYLMSVMDLWGSNVSLLMTVHLVYILPFIDDGHLPLIARHLVNGIREGTIAWNEYVNSQHFHEASRLHPHIFLSICSTLVTMSGSCKRKISEFEDTPTTKKNYCKKLLKKMEKIGPLLCEFGGERDEKNALWDALRECGNMVMKLIENAGARKKNKGNSLDLSIMVKLIGNFPLSFLHKELQTALLLVLFALLIQEDLEGTEENVSSLLHIINQTLCSHCQFRLFKVTDAGCLLKWLIKKRFDFPLSLVTQHMANLTQTLMTEKASSVLPTILPDTKTNSKLTAQALVGQSFDQVLNTLMYKLTAAASNAQQIKDISVYITSPETAKDAELFLQPAVFLMDACHKNIQHCKETLHYLSSWILKYLKKMDLTTTAPPTAAAILAAHSIIVLTEISHYAIKKKLNSQILESDIVNVRSITNISEDPENAQKNCDLEEQTLKTPLWQKLLGHSCHLAKLCLSSGHCELQECTLHYLIIVLQHYSILQSRLPSDIFITTWTALSRTDHIPRIISALPHSKCIIKPLLSGVSPDDYEKLLHDLLKSTQSDTTNLVCILKLWQVIIFSKVFGVNGAVKRVALEHLMPILVNLVTVHNASDKCTNPYLIPLLETLRELISFALKFEAQTIALVLTPCTTIHLQTMPLDQFSQAFTAVVDIVNCIVLLYPSVVAECVPSVLASITHLATSLITQANQEYKLDDDQIKIMADCGSNLERIVSQLNSFRVRLNKVAHFTVAAIISSLQLTTVYPAVKTILETIIYRLLGLCDSHCLNHLLVALPPATKTLLKYLHSNYLTYRFKTK